MINLSTRFFVFGVDCLFVLVSLGFGRERKRAREREVEVERGRTTVFLRGGMGMVKDVVQVFVKVRFRFHVSFLESSRQRRRYLVGSAE